MTVRSSLVILNRVGYFWAKRKRFWSNIRRNKAMKKTKHNQPLADNELVTETPGKPAERVEETDINGLTPAVCRPYGKEKMQWTHSLYNFDGICCLIHILAMSNWCCCYTAFYTRLHKGVVKYLLLSVLSIFGRILSLSYNLFHECGQFQSVYSTYFTIINNHGFYLCLASRSVAYSQSSVA